MAEKNLIPYDLTKNEMKIILALRSLKPFEKVTVSADKNGKPDNFLVERSYKEVLSTED